VHDRLKKILSKKRDLHPIEKEAKMNVIKHLKDMASHEMGGKLDGLKKVSVMSDSEKGLEKGLDKAKDILTGSEFDKMKNHAENPYGDYKSALEEHANDEDNTEKMSEGGMTGYDDGGEVQNKDQDPRKSAQDSMRKDFGYNEGGEIEGNDESEEDESQEPDEDSDDQDMTEEEIDAKLAELMALKKQKEAKK
jgi:hypothetical protein